MVLITVAIATLVVKAYLIFPIPYQSGIEGHGLYRFLNERQFFETAISTFSTIFLMAWLVLKLRCYVSILLSIAFVLTNFGLMVMDARLNTYHPLIEQLIERLYGNIFFVFGIASLSICMGVIIIILIMRSDNLLRSLNAAPIAEDGTS